MACRGGAGLEGARARARAGALPGMTTGSSPAPGGPWAGRAYPRCGTPEPTTPPNLAPARAPENPSRWVRGARSGHLPRDPKASAGGQEGGKGTRPGAKPGLELP